MARLAIIPARGGSKRIPRKNIRLFHGKPIIAYSIEAGLRCGLFDTVMVSTDDDSIREIAEKYGASVPFMRSEKNSSDTATTLEVINEVLGLYRDMRRHYDEVCCIYATAPLIQEKDLQTGLEMLKGNVASVFPVTAFSFPILRSLKVDDENNVSMNWPKFAHSRSQDLPAAYHDAGQWYWIRPELIKDSLYTNTSKAVILSEIKVQDLDNEVDWQMAELKYTLLREDN